MTLSTSSWRGRKVWISGHTGFIGGWLALALTRAGAEVHGYALPPPTTPSFFTATGLAGCLASDVRCDIRAAGPLTDAMTRSRCDVVFHLAAQPIVRLAWAEPADTIDANVMGSVRVLDAIRKTPSVMAAVIMTTDKVYANREWLWPYRETDQLGGSEPYAASKAACELIVDAYRRSYFDGGARIATVRAGNVIGGGDWAMDRIIPDAIRAFTSGEVLVLRHPEAVRPWQNVIDVVSGLLQVAEKTIAGSTETYNIAPPAEEQVSVGELVGSFAAIWGAEAKVSAETATGPKETRMLRLDASKARLDLGWSPRLDIAASLERTCGWYRDFYAGADMMQRSIRDLDEVLS